MISNEGISTFIISKGKGIRKSLILCASANIVHYMHPLWTIYTESEVFVFLSHIDNI